MSSETNEISITNLLLGFAVSLGASLMDAAGVNLLNLDHVRNASRPAASQRNECGRPMWHLGLYMYIASQMIGSSFALYFLKAQWVAPLGSVALIFNFIFARVLVGTRITKKDILGTFVVIISVIWIVVFGGMNSGNGEENITLEKLKDLFVRPLFIVYFSILDVLTFGLSGVTFYCYWIVKNERRKKAHAFFQGIETSRLRKFVGMTMAGLGGLIASQTLLLAKSGVKLLSRTLAGDNQFTDNLSWFILIGLAGTAVSQLFCLNTALKLHDSVLVVPIFYGFYTAMGLINSMIYLDELATYPPWAIFLVMLGIGTLIYGVLLLSAAKEPPATNKGLEQDGDDAQKIESSSNVDGWDDLSLGAGSSNVGSEAEILGEYNQKQPGMKRIGNNSSSGFFKLVRLRKNSNGSKLSNQHRRSSDNNIDVSGSSTPHIIIDDEFSETSSPYSNTVTNYNLMRLGNISLDDTNSSQSHIDYSDSMDIDPRSFDDLLSTNRK